MAVTGDVAKTLNAAASDADHVPCVAYGWPLGFRPENVRLYEETATTICNGTRPGFTVGVVVQSAGFKAGQGVKAHGIGFEEERDPTLASESGGNSVPSVCAVVYDARGNGDGKTVPTLTGDHENRVTGYTAVAVEPVCIPIQDQATRYSGKRGDKSDGKGNGLGIGNDGDPMNTLTSGDRHAVCYAMQAFGKYTESDTASAMKARDYKDATDLVCECAGVDCRNMNEYEELYPTLQAKPNGGQSLNFSGAVRVRYIVRRLTPTECARLQGFPDAWGHPDPKDSLTDEEYSFWLEVRNTHAAINGKAVKEYTRDQMLKWYNSLHTDSAEYKMWGNGIALPPALYVMQGIAEVMQ